MNKKELQAIAQAAAKNIKTEADLNEFRQMLTKITVETALNAELDDHLGFDKHEPSDSENSRNGFTRKTLQTEDGQFELATQFKGLNDLVEVEAELTKELGNRLMGEFRENLEFAGEAQKSYRAWFEKGLADVTEKAS